MEAGNETQVTLSGTIIFLLDNVGSKSESKHPYLYQNSDSCIPVFKESDNPFENEGLKSFDGKKVEIKGQYGRGDVFCISEIKEF